MAGVERYCEHQIEYASNLLTQMKLLLDPTPLPDGEQFNEADRSTHASFHAVESRVYGYGQVAALRLYVFHCGICGFAAQGH